MLVMIALVSTVFNEEKNISGLLSDIKAQTKKPDEVIFVDAGSQDKTKSLLEGNVNLVVKDGVGRSEGRNMAIERSESGIIAVCDAGTRISKDFLENLTKHLDNNSDIDVVSGFFLPDAKTFYEKCMASATIPILDEIEEDKFLPSSRSIAFKKSAWEQVGGYPEWLPICEDLVFDIKLKTKGFKFKFEPKAIAYWKPREKVSAFFKQYFLYARGDGHAKLWLARHIIRYTSYVTGFLFIYLSLTVSGLWLLPFFAAQFGYLSKFFYRYLGHFPNEPEFLLAAAFPYISLLVVLGDVAKMVGYPVGVYERVTGKIKFEEYRE